MSTPKVFRTHSIGLNTTDWFQSNEINADVIENLNVQDTKGTRQPTSIPSPFARIDLVRNAFIKVSSPDQNNKISLDKNSDAHKLVSDSLDVGQMLFNYDRHKEILTLERWNKNDSINSLKNSTNKKHCHLGETLDLFLKQDAAQYNYDQMDNLFILKYDHKVIGGTSPRTLFFASPRSESIDVNINFAQDKMLDDEILPLFKREPEYIKYLFGLKKFIPNFSSLFKEFSTYLNETLDELREYDNGLYREINELDQNHFDRLSIMTMPNSPGINVSVLNGLELRSAPLIEPIESDFIIRCSKRITGKKPLVLPIKTFAKNWKYTTGNWNQNTHVPVYDSQSLDKRHLPEQNDQYPYLTINDFLGESIVRLPYKINSKKFLVAGQSNFLLPLTKRFFEYFEASDIGNKVKIEVVEQEQYGGLTKVKLSIPVAKGQNEFIEYEKTYKRNENALLEASIESKEGVIIEGKFALSVNPFIAAPAGISMKYDIGLASLSPLNGDITIAPMNSETLVPIPVFSRVRSNNLERLTSHHSFNSTFDLIEVGMNGRKNYLIPRLQKAITGNNNYSFAIDFGTTNSHIEVKVSDTNRIEPFMIKEHEQQIVYLRDRNGNDEMLRGQDKVYVEDGEDYLKQESLPEMIHEKAIHKFPLRTNILENVTVDYATETRVYTDCNIGFDYEKQSIKPYMKFKTELKWSDVNETANRVRILRYIEEILELCKNKVIFNNGNLSNTQLTWFYPISMTGSRKNMLKGIWKEAIDKVFHDLIPSDNIRSISESIAPFYYYKENEGIMTQTAPAISIDIGGGTSDVVVFEKGKPTLISSFKYAGNAIFGDGLNKNPEMNGFVKTYKTVYEDLLKRNNLTNELKVLDEIFSKANRSSDFVNFLFSLNENSNYRNAGAPSNFETELKENYDLKLVFLVYYSALFYHIAQLMKLANISKPASILFSGTGSKTSFILNGDDSNWEITEKLINEIFDFVYEDQSKSKVKITIDKRPKEITSKGGLSINDEVENIYQMVTIHLGGQEKLMEQRPLNEQFENVLFRDLNDGEFNEVKMNVLDFFRMLEVIKEKVSFKSLFGVTTKANSALNEILKDDRLILDYIMLGYEEELKEAGDDAEPLEETLFFYPIIGILNDLAHRISNS